MAPQSRPRDIFSASLSLQRTGKSCHEVDSKIMDHEALVIFVVFFLQDESNWADSHLTTFSAIDPSYSLPGNVALITLQVLVKPIVHVG